MVKTARTLPAAAALALAALACLAGCNFGVGIFPDRLTGYEAYTDIAGDISPDRIRDYSFQLIRDSSTGAEYLVLASDNRAFDGTHVAVFDADLKSLGKYTIEDLDAMDPNQDYAGRGAMVDSNGGIVVGNRRFTVSSRRLSYAGTPPPVLNSTSFALPEATLPNVVNLWTESVSSVRLRYDIWSKDWTSSSFHSLQFMSGMFQAKILGAWVRDTDVAAIIRVDKMDTRIHLLDRAKLAAGTLDTPIHDNPPGSPVPSFDQMWSETLGYTDAGFAAFFGDPVRKYVLFGVNGMPLEYSGTVSDNEWPDDQRQVYGRTGGWYILRMKDMTLERRAWWWK